MTTNNPQSVVVSADIHQAIMAVCEFSEKYPAERLSMAQAYAIEKAAQLIRERIVSLRDSEVV